MSNFFHIINFSSFVIHYLLYTFIIFHYVDIAKATTSTQNGSTSANSNQQSIINNTTTLKPNESSQQTSSPTSTTQKISSTNQNQQTSVKNKTSVIYTTTPSTNSKTTQINVIWTEATVSSIVHVSVKDNKPLVYNPTVLANKTLVPIITPQVTNLSIFDGNNSKINSTEKPDSSKSSLPVVLASVFGSLAVIVLIACIITYVLIKKGYIKIFNQPRTQRKNNEQTKIADSSSTIGEGSPSQR